MAEAMPSAQAAALADFARTCKAAARAVTLYPSTHPAIQAALARVVSATGRLANGAGLTLTIQPELIEIDGTSPARPDPAIGELAALLHDRLIGSLHIEPDADAGDWLALLLLVARSADDLRASGGITRAWRASGRRHFDIREIDYAEVLRERAGGEAAEWQRIVAHCLQSDAAALDERAIAAILDAFGDPERLRRFLDTLQTAAPDGASVTIGARAAALLQLLRLALEEAGRRGAGTSEAILQTVADTAASLDPDMMLALIAAGRAGGPEGQQVVDAVVDRMGDGAIASFVAGSIVRQRGATERLAQAFQALVPGAERRERLIELARAEAADGELGEESGFETLWQTAASMLTTYTDQKYVSDEYARELSAARVQAIEVDRVADDPPDRVQRWMATVSGTAVRRLDLALLQDLLRLEKNPDNWHAVARAAVAEIDRRTLLGEIADALALVEAIAGDEGMLDALAAGPIVRHIVLAARTVHERDVEPLQRLARAIGPRLARPLAEALAAEDNNRAIMRLRGLLLGFGAAGRQSVEQLKHSANPAIRRTAVDLLRVFGGREALPELASMLDDADPHVQREAIRAIVQVGTDEAYAVLERVLVAGGRSRDTVLRELIGFRDDKVIPLLCYVLNHSAPRGRLAAVHAQIIETLGNLKATPESTNTLRAVLHRGEWWAPARTRALRQAAAAALRRIGAPETLAVLDEAAERGSRGVRQAARAQIGIGRRERVRP